MRKKVLVTGGASGLGRAITEMLCQDGKYEVFFTYSTSADGARELEQKYENAHGYRCDFFKYEDIEELKNVINEINIDVLINNALPFKISQQHFHKIDRDIFINGFKNNVMPVIEITSQAISIFRKKKEGKIITILTSYLINKPPVGFSEYTAAKAYLHSLAKSWANEYVALKISSNCVSPSFMLTGLASELDERIIEEASGKHPLKQLLPINETARAVQYLVEASPHVNGLNLIINSAENIL
jgi:3-oxoacyl-[acyl-carrier protein] reductase